MTARARAAALSVAIVVAAGADAIGAADASRWWAHVTYLADDSLEGREAGRPGYTRAAEYVADVWRKAGLEPAYAGQFLQPVALKTRQIDESRSSLALVRDGRVEPLMLGEDANFSLRIDPALDVDAPLVFTGHGLNVPDARHQRPRGPEPEGRRGRVLLDADRLASRPAAGALRVERRTLAGAARGRRDRDDHRARHRAPRGALGAIDPCAPAAADVAGGSGSRRISGSADRRHDESRQGRRAVCRIGAHAGGAGRHRSGRTAASPLRAAGARQGDDRGQPLDRRVAERRRRPARRRPGPARRGRRAVGASRSCRRRRPRGRRSHLQRRDGQRVGRGDHSRSRRAASRIGLPPGAVDCLRRRDGRGAGRAGLALFRRASAGRPADRRQRQHGHVPAALPAAGR